MPASHLKCLSDGSGGAVEEPVAAAALEGLCSGGAAVALLAGFCGLGIRERPAARCARAARA